MASVTVSKMIYSPVSRVYATWVDEYSDVYKFHPALKYSEVSSVESSKIGADRTCYMKDQKNWVKEKIVDLEPNKSLALSVHESSMPIKSANVQYAFESVDFACTKLTVTIDFKPALGILGRLMTPMMKAQFRSLLTELLEANAAYVETGAQVNPTRITA